MSRTTPRAYTVNGGYRMFVEPMKPEDLRLYRQVWACRLVLGLRAGSATILRTGLRAQITKLERECARRGLDWRAKLGPRDEGEHLAALAKKKKPRRARVESPPE